MKKIPAESQGSREEGKGSFPPFCSLGLLKDCELLQGPISLSGQRGWKLLQNPEKAAGGAELAAEPEQGRQGF